MFDDVWPVGDGVGYALDRMGEHRDAYLCNGSLVLRLPGRMVYEMPVGCPTFEDRKARLERMLGGRLVIHDRNVNPEPVGEGATCPCWPTEQGTWGGANSKRGSSITSLPPRGQRGAIRATVAMLAADLGAKAIQKRLRQQNVNLPLTTVKRYLREARHGSGNDAV